MFESNEGIIIALICSTLLLVFFAAVVIYAIFIYQNRQRSHLKEVEDLKMQFKQELLKAELEVRQNTLIKISEEIHDNIGQVLSLAKLNLNTLGLEAKHPLYQKINATKGFVGKAIQDLRDLSHTFEADEDLCPSLLKSLRAEIEAIAKTGQFEASFSVNGKEAMMDGQRQLIAFRIVQESLQNIIKHSQANQISLSLSYLSDTIFLNIVDDGIGFDLKEINNRKEYVSTGNGLRNLFRRARLIGGHLNIITEPGKGTEIKLSIPIELKI